MFLFVGLFWCVFVSLTLGVGRTCVEVFVSCRLAQCLRLVRFPAFAAFPSAEDLARWQCGGVRS